MKREKSNNILIYPYKDLLEYFEFQVINKCLLDWYWNEIDLRLN